MKASLLALSFLTVCGCACIDLHENEISEIEGLHQSGITWSRERNNGSFEPPISMCAAVCWGILPGAGQIFMADKISDAGLDDRFSRDCTQLNVSGWTMIAVSWFPLVYDATLPFGIGGIVQDVNRVNNYALLKHQQKLNNQRKNGKSK